MSLTTEQKAKAFDLFCQQVEKSIEDEIPNWLDENPYWEIDDEDCNDNRIFRCPRTTTADAREGVTETILNQADDMGFYDFFEFVIYCIYGEPMRKENKFREQKEEKKPAQAEVNPMEAVLKSQKQMLDMMFAPLEKAIERAAK